MTSAPRHHKSLHRSSLTTNNNHGNDGNNHRQHCHSQQQNQQPQHNAVVLKKLYLAASICSMFLLVEILGGYWSGSLAIWSDASHLFADLASFGIAIVASHLANLPSTTTHTFGLRRAESLAALISMASLAVVSIGLAMEAIRRLYRIVSFHNHSSSEEGQTQQLQLVDGSLMSIIAAIGVVVNIILALILGGNHFHLPGSNHHHHQHSDDHHHDHHNHDHHHHPQAAAAAVAAADTTNNEHDHEHSHEHSHNHHESHDVPPTIDSERQGLLSHSTATTTTDCQERPSISSYDTILHSDEVLPFLPTNKNNNNNNIENINLKAAYLHVMGDLAQSMAVFVAGILLWIFPQAQILDPLCTMLFCGLVFYSTLSVVRSSLAVLLEEIPPQVNWIQVYDAISAVPDISHVHDLHIWSISHEEPSLSVHCVSTRSSNHHDEALRDVYRVCQQFGIAHATIQLQHSDQPCITCEDGWHNNNEP